MGCETSNLDASIFKNLRDLGTENCYLSSLVTSLSTVINTTPPPPVVEDSIVREQILTDTNLAYSVPPNFFVWGVIIVPGSVATIIIGTGVGLDDIAEAEVVPVTGMSFFFPRFKTTGQNIYIGGLVAGSKVTILRTIITP